MSYNHSLKRIAKLLPGIGDQPKTTYLNGIGERVKAYKQGLEKELKASNTMPSNVVLPLDNLPHDEAQKVMGLYSGNYDYHPINTSLRLAQTPQDGLSIFTNNSKWKNRYEPKEQKINKKNESSDIERINNTFKSIFNEPAVEQIGEGKYGFSEYLKKNFNIVPVDEAEKIAVGEKIDRLKEALRKNNDLSTYYSMINHENYNAGFFNLTDLPKKTVFVVPTQEEINNTLASQYAQTIAKVPVIESVLKQQPTYLETLPLVENQAGNLTPNLKDGRLIRGLRFQSIEDKDKYVASLDKRKMQNQFVSVTTNPNVAGHFTKGNGSVKHIYLQDSYGVAHDGLNPAEAEYIFPPGTYFHTINKIDVSPEHTMIATRAIENPEITIKRLQAQGINPSLADRIKIKRYAMGLYPEGTNLADIQPPVIGG